MTSLAEYHKSRLWTVNVPSSDVTHVTLEEHREFILQVAAQLTSGTALVCMLGIWMHPMLCPGLNFTSLKAWTFSTAHPETRPGQYLGFHLTSCHLHVWQPASEPCHLRCHRPEATA